MFEMVENIFNRNDPYSDLLADMHFPLKMIPIIYRFFETTNGLFQKAAARSVTIVATTGNSRVEGERNQMENKYLSLLPPFIPFVFRFGMTVVIQDIFG